MQTTFVIDQDKTFGAAKFTKIAVAPKEKFGSAGEQATTKDGVPQWVAQLLVQYRNGFGVEVAEVLKLTIAAESDPGKSIPDMSPVEVEGLTVGVMEGRDGQGFSMFFRAESLAPVASGSRPAKPAESKAA